MEKPRNSKSTFRQRGYTCTQCGMGTMIFGNGDDQMTCPSCNADGMLKKEWDHIVVTTVQVEPVPAA